MDDIQIISIIMALNGSIMLMLIAIWAKLNRFDRAISTLCREHKQHHGGELINT